MEIVYDMVPGWRIFTGTHFSSRLRICYFLNVGDPTKTYSYGYVCNLCRKTFKTVYKCGLLIINNITINRKPCDIVPYWLTYFGNHIHCSPGSEVNFIKRIHNRRTRGNEQDVIFFSPQFKNYRYELRGPVSSQNALVELLPIFLYW